MLEKLALEGGQVGVFFFVGKKLLHERHLTVGDLYELNKEVDGYLYITYG